jgi:hypothetical protein
MMNPAPKKQETIVQHSGSHETQQLIRTVTDGCYCSRVQRSLCKTNKIIQRVPTKTKQ